MPDAPGVSVTARRVAAYRLGMQRLAPPTDAGDPAADEGLAADVAAGLSVDTSTPMGRYLRARTAFFDRVTVNALGRGVTQIVVIGAGYDGRALRYRSPGVRWWEVDRLATQADKRARLSRLGMQPDAATYVALDLADGELAASLAGSGFEPDTPALYLAEGVVPYLDTATLHRVLDQLRSLATPGTRLALSLRRSDSDPAARARFDAGVAALGEPAVGSASVEDAGEWLTERRWRPVDLSERSRSAGFVVAAPIFAPPALGAPPTIGRIGTFLEQMLHRSGWERLGAHLEQVYGVAVTATRELDVGVHRVERADGTTWVARLFPPARPLGAVRGDAALLDWLVEAGIPAERTAAADPVTEHDGQAVLVTEFVPGRHPAGSPALFEQLGVTLGQIQGLPADNSPADRAGGAWHHLVLDATPAEELVAVRRLLDDARHRVRRGTEASYELLCEAVDALRFPSDLPLAVVHPDLVPRNVLKDGDNLTVTDWSGAGRGPRVISLGCLLWSTAGHGPSVDAVMRGYRRTVSLHSVEIDHLADAIALRPLILACWTFATGRSPVDDSATWWADQRRLLSKTSIRATATASSSSPPPKRSPPRRPRSPRATSTIGGELVTETFDYDGGRQVTAYIPQALPQAVLFAGDGQLVSPWGAFLNEAADLPPTMVVAAHRLADETDRLREYSPVFDAQRFAAHERFFVHDLRRWASSLGGVSFPVERTAVFGASAGGELALAVGLRHPDIYGTILCASPGGGYKPPGDMQDSVPRTYLVAGTREPFFHQNAVRWAAALRGAGADVVMTERVGAHGGAFWRDELPLMVAWAFGR